MGNVKTGAGVSAIFGAFALLAGGCGTADYRGTNGVLYGNVYGRGYHGTYGYPPQATFGSSASAGQICARLLADIRNPDTLPWGKDAFRPHPDFRLVPEAAVMERQVYNYLTHRSWSPRCVRTAALAERDRHAVPSEVFKACAFETTGWKTANPQKLSAIKSALDAREALVREGVQDTCGAGIVQDYRLKPYF